MKILWLCNIILPDISRHLKESVSMYGGWIDGLSKDLRKNLDSLNIVFPFHKEISGSIDNMFYNSFIYNKNYSIEDRFINLLKEYKPDIIHIWGTEYIHTLKMVDISIRLGLIDKLVISIQGLCSIYAKHYFADLPKRIIKNYSFRDFIKHDNINNQRKKFIKRGKFEIEAIKKVKHIIGRTDWDRACTYQINPKAEYHFCNETLRDSFYEGDIWDYEKCEKHSIFISQANYPIKGLHYLLEALPLILKDYPDTKVYIAGKNIIANENFIEKLKISSYGKYIRSLIKLYGLENKLVFTDNLSEGDMKQRYLGTNVFVSPSSIENSPNSVCEAMILGVPVIASDVGGIKDLLEHKKEGFVYQSDAPYMLAFYIKKIFDFQGNIICMTKSARKRALITHDKELNIQILMQIYKSI